MVYASLLLIGLSGYVRLVAQPDTDQLKAQLAAERDVHKRIAMLNELAEHYARSEPMQTIRYADEAIALAQEVEDIGGLAEAFHKRSMGLLYTNSNDSALLAYSIREAIALSAQVPDSQLLARCYLLHAGWYNRYNMPDSAFVCYQRTLDLARRTGNQRAEFAALNSLSIMSQEHRRDDALAYGMQALNLARKMDDKLCIGAASNSIGNYFFSKRDFAAALAYYRESIEVKKTTGDKLGTIVTTCNLCLTYYHLGKTREARTLIEEGLQLALAVGKNDRMMSCLSELANLELMEQNYSAALAYGQRGLDLAGQTHVSLADHKNMLAIMARAAAGKGDYQQAYLFHQEYKTLSDSFEFGEANRRLEDLRLAYRTEDLATRNDLLTQRIRNQRLLNITACLLVTLMLFISFFFYYRYRSQQRVKAMLEQKVEARTADLRQLNEELKQANAELESFVYIVSHDFKEPLRNISSFTGLLARKLAPEVRAAHSDLFDFITGGVTQMRALLDDILAFTHTRKLSVEREPVDPNEVLDEVLLHLQDTLRQRGAVVHREPLPVLPAYRGQLYLLLKNLIENGIKYNQSPVPEVHIQCRQTPDGYYFRVRDNGIGISREYFDYVFMMFKRLHSRSEYQGSGMGLAICVRVLQQLGGKIWIEQSEPGQGSTFVCYLPAMYPVEEVQRQQPVHQQALS
ncbi:MAG: hypothetical protein OHK0039_34340 [Bacteroidia bacterium]